MTLEASASCPRSQLSVRTDEEEVCHVPGPDQRQARLLRHGFLHRLRCSLSALAVRERQLPAAGRLLIGGRRPTARSRQERQENDSHARYRHPPTTNGPLAHLGPPDLDRERAPTRGRRASDARGVRRAGRRRSAAARRPVRGSELPRVLPDTCASPHRDPRGLGDELLPQPRRRRGSCARESSRSRTSRAFRSRASRISSTARKNFIADGSRPYLATRTTGTTGRPTQIWLSRQEMELWPSLAALSGLLRGEIGPDDCMQINISSRATAAVQQNMTVCALAGRALPRHRHRAAGGEPRRFARPRPGSAHAPVHVSELPRAARSSGA